MTTKYLRYADLVERQIVNNRTTLQRWTHNYGFPVGVLLGPNSRAWPENQVDAWLAARAAARQAPVERDDVDADGNDAEGEDDDAEDEDEAA